MHVERTLTVNQPPTVVVDYLRDFAHTEAWDPGTKSCVREDSGPVIVGSRWKNVSEFRGHETELDYHLESDDGSRLVFIGENPTATSTDDISVRGHDGRTTVTYNATIEFHGLAKLADPFIRPGFSSLADDTVVKLTEVLAAL
jgi:carbon monoxide dehydrogenase subunit G